MDLEPADRPDSGFLARWTRTIAFASPSPLRTLYPYL